MHKRSAVARGIHSLLASLVPGVGFAAALWLVRDQPRFAFLPHLSDWPWELWLLSAAGCLATAAGVADWRYHRRCGIFLSAQERRGEFIALASGGLPLFALMLAASALGQPHRLLLPVIVVAGWTTAWVCYDEFVFHRRRCQRFEHMLHRTLVFGHAVAFLSWCHWCFVRQEMLP